MATPSPPASSTRGELTLEIAPAKIASVCGFLKYDQKFVRLSTVTAVDRYPAEPRFEVVYHLHSHRAQSAACA